MEQIIKHFKTILPCDQFVVTGSYVLALNGLVDKPKDLDIILYKPKEGVIDLLKELQKTQPAKTKAPENSKKGLISIIEHQGVKIDFFISQIKIDAINVGDYEISTIKGIVEAKKNIGRIKDYYQLLKIAESITTKQEILGKFTSGDFLKESNGYETDM